MATRILIVDDEPELLEVMEMQMNDLGLETVCAGSAQEALKLAGEQAFSLVFTDVMMPGMSGLELIQNLRAQGFSQPAVVYTGYSSELDTLEAQKAQLNIVAIIDKPFRNEDIETSVQIALS